MTVDRLAERLGASFRRFQQKALTTEGTYQGRRLVLAKPQTYMNSSGLAASGLVRFYKVPHNHLMVVYDDLDLPLGTIRIRPKGGSGGQGGLKSIIERLGGQDFPRMRLGIGRPPGTMDPASYVLHNFKSDERVLLPAILDAAVDAILVYMTEGIEAAMTGFNKQVI
jgi:PTH1 family peptidyl-tRNA hydrolase